MLGSLESAAMQLIKSAELHHVQPLKVCFLCFLAQRGWGSEHWLVPLNVIDCQLMRQHHSRAWENAVHATGMTR